MVTSRMVSFSFLNKKKENYCGAAVPSVLFMIYAQLGTI
nr:MAG TPA: hypothetical protein [Caudoviricetes sp.]